jgi:hypothetical protein
MTHNERGDLLTGDSNGTVYVWGDGGNRITNFIKHAHDVSHRLFLDIVQFTMLLCTICGPNGLSKSNMETFSLYHMFVKCR